MTTQRWDFQLLCIYLLMIWPTGIKTDESAKRLAHSVRDQLRCMQCCAGIKWCKDPEGQSPHKLVFALIDQNRLF